MTEISKNSRNKGAVTDSNTVERSKEGPTHPYSGNDSETPSNYSGSQSRHEQSPEDLDYNFEVALQYIMPLISTIKDENQHLKHEKSRIEQQMTTLHKLSQLVLTENQQLRRHYCGRTSDIKKLIETITINTNEEINDVNHQSFLVKESNCLIVKQIQTLMKKIEEIKGSNHSKQIELDEMAQKNVLTEQTVRDLQVKNKQLFYRCEKLKGESSKVNASENDGEINELLCEVTALKNTNKHSLQKAKFILSDHNQQKPLVQQNLTNLKSKNKELAAESKELQEKMKVAEVELSEKRVAYEESTEKLVQSMKDFEKGKYQLGEKERELVKIRTRMGESAARAKKYQSDFAGLGEEKERLLTQIKNKKQTLKKLEESFRQANEQQQASCRNAVKKIKANVSQQQISANQQICSNIAPQSTRFQSSISQSKEQFVSLVQQVDQLRESLSRLQNPVKELIRWQYQLKKRGRK